jgi:hypothetical protein
MSKTLEEHVQGDGRVPLSVGDIAYRTVKCSEERWEKFRDTLQKQVLRIWDDEAVHGFDPEGSRHRWALFVVYVGGVNGLTNLAILRQNFTETIDSWFKMKLPRRWKPSLNNFFLINEEVMDSVLEGLARGETPFIYAASENFKPGDEDGPYEGHFKVAVEELGMLWFLVGYGDMRMESARPSEKGAIQTGFW